VAQSRSIALDRRTRGLVAPARDERPIARRLRPRCHGDFSSGPPPSHAAFCRSVPFQVECHAELALASGCALNDQKS
jgi:hypothetical protein